MAKSKSLSELAKHLQGLQERRAEFAKQIIAIDKTLAKVGAALGAAPAAFATQSDSATEDAGPVRRKRRRKRARFSMSGEESILAFIKANKKPTTQDLKKHWSSEGRGGTADNALSKLVKERKLKREPLDGQRGSRYLLP
jgi:hypothetical protein